MSWSTSLNINYNKAASSIPFQCSCNSNNLSEKSKASYL